MFEKRLVFSIPGMERNAARTNLIYKNLDDGPLHADLYLPSAATAPAPIAILIHGGIPEGLAIKLKDGALFVSWGQLMAASSMAGVTFNHRMRWNNGFVPGSIEKASADLRDLIQFLGDNASALRVDAHRICLVAFSAGGPLLAAPILERWEGIKCLAAFYAYLGDTTPREAKDAARYSALGALNAARTAVPPMFIARAGKDFALINDSINAFVKAARELGTQVEFITHPEGVHGFDFENDDETSRAIVREALKFICSHLGLQLSS
jgi:acetyl esterase/lipase